MPVSNDQIVDKIREFRKKSGKTQLDLGNLLGKTTASISDLERGRVQVSASDLSQISDFLKIPITNFYEIETEDNEITDVAGNVVFARLIDRFELDELEEVSGFPFEIVEQKYRHSGILISNHLLSQITEPIRLDVWFN